MTKSEDKKFEEVINHYDMAKEDLDMRISDFDKADELFRSYIDEANWPYSAMIFLPRIFTSLFEKTSRLLGNKLRGRLLPRENGDVVKAKINNILLEYQWDDAERVDNLSMLAKWAMMDMNARKYGASFGLCKWHFEKRNDQTWFDGPSFQILNNRDVLANPSYPNIKNWFQYREYLTMDELESINDAARGKPAYKNLDELKEKIKGEVKVMDTRDANYQSRNKSIKGATDYLGRDTTNKIIEIVTEYTPTKWTTFAPKHGVIIREIDNPYKHKEIPVVMLRYYSIDDDLYGIPEWEPVEKTQKALNALTSQYIDAVNIELHSPIGVDSTRVRMHTLEMGANKKWIVSGDPRGAIVKYDFGSPAAIGSFKTTYSILIGEMQEALGEASAINSTMNPLAGSKTATEIKDTSAQRLARDNFNQLFLAEALKKQMMFWLSMNQQYYFKPKEQSRLLRVVGKENLDYFKKMGLDAKGMDDETMNTVVNAQEQGVDNLNLDEYQQPINPVQTPKGIVPKLEISDDTNIGQLWMEPGDLSGNYDYIADVQSMMPPSQQQEIAAKRAAVEMAINPAVSQILMTEGKSVKLSELLEDYYEQLGFKDAGKYFISSQPPNGQPQGQPQPGGEGIAPPVPPDFGNGQAGGMGAVQGVPQGQDQPLMAGPQGM